MEIANKIVMMPVSRVKPYVRNPRKNDKTVALLVDIIPKVGFNVPLVVDKNGVIVKGHARFTAALRLGMTEVPCVVTDADEEAIKLDRIADNKISEFSEWVTDELLHEVDSLNIDFDLESLGLPAIGLDDAFEPLFDDDEGESEGEKKNDDRALKMAEYEAFLKAQKEAQERQIEGRIEKAEKNVVIEPPKQKYFKIVCPDCGRELFVRECDAILVEQ